MITTRLDYGHHNLSPVEAHIYTVENGVKRVLRTLDESETQGMSNALSHIAQNLPSVRFSEERQHVLRALVDAVVEPA